MMRRLGLEEIVLISLLTIGCLGEEMIDCNMDTDKFSHVVKDGAHACSKEFHKQLQAYYPTDQEFKEIVETQPPRAIMAPRPMRYSAIGDRIFFSNVSNWGSVCRLWVEAAECVSPVLMDCDISVSFKIIQDRLHAYKYKDNSQPDLLAPEYAFSERTCRSGKIMKSLKKDLDDPALDLSCLTHEERIQFKQCVSPLTAEIIAHKMRAVYTSKKDIMVLDSISGSVLRCIRNILDMSSCNSVSQRIWNHIGQLNLPAIFINPPNVTLPSNYDFSHKRRCTVGAYGDPHFRLCSRPKLVTCSLPGTHIFLSNHFFEIRGTNSKVEARGMINPPATAITQIRITFKSMLTSKDIGVYEAGEGSFPAGFQETGATQIGTGDDAITMTVDGNKRTFTQESTGMVLIIRQNDRFYHVIIRMAQQVLDDSYGVLVTGCTMLQTINTKGWIQNHRTRMRRDLTVDECITKCQDLPETMGLRIACAFDCGVTSNAMFIDISKEAWRDMVEIEGLDTRLRQKAKTRWIRDTSNSSSTGRNIVPTHICYLSTLILIAYFCSRISS